MKLTILETIKHYLHLDHVVAAVVAQSLAYITPVLKSLIHKLKGVIMNKRYYLYIIIGFAYLVYDWVFLAVVKTQSAVMQLEDSDAAYAIGAKWATGSKLETFLYLWALVLVIYSLIRIIFYKQIKTTKSET